MRESFRAREARNEVWEFAPTGAEVAAPQYSWHKREPAQLLCFLSVSTTHSCIVRTLLSLLDI